MLVSRLTILFYAITGAVLIGGVAAPGCSSSQTTTGTMVERTPEQLRAEKAAMEGMRKAMSNVKAQRKSR